MNSPLRLMFVGDLILDEPEPRSFFACSEAVLGVADVLVGHVEVPHTDRGSAQSLDVPAPPAGPAHLDALSDVGFDVVTLAGNHIFDSGPEGVADTRSRLESGGIVTAGAGSSLAEASRPAIVERAGRRIGVLSYNCVGPRESWATSAKAGCAYIQILTHYELDHATPGGPPTIYTFPAADGMRRLEEDVAALRQDVDVAVVALHKGIGHVPAELAMYEQQVARAAVDAGADIVVAHHAHILRGIEIYRGRPIYHGLGNFVTVTRALSPSDDNDSAERRAWARRREELFGFRPDPEMPFYPFHPESRNTIIATWDIDADGNARAGFVPCYIDEAGRPEALGYDARGRAVADYVENISNRAGLAVELEWAGDRVRVAGTER